MTFEKSRVGKSTAYRWWFLALVILFLAVIAATLVLLKYRLSPFLRNRAVAMLGDRFESEVEIREFKVSYPLAVDGAGLTLRLHGRSDVPPLLSVQKFHVDASLSGLLHWHLRQIKVEGLQIQIPPREKKPESPKEEEDRQQIPVSVEEFVSDNAELILIPRDPEKDPHIFEIHRLVMHGLGLGRAASFTTTLTNATPPGEIETVGQFGPWERDDPSSTPVDAKYTFSHADLGVFKGISGILSSTGQFVGPLKELAVKGETTTPDFMVDVGGHPVLLKTTFEASVDGSNGDTLLHPVIAEFLHSKLICNGAIVKGKSAHGKEIALYVTANHARLEDLMALGVKGKPPMTGAVNLKTRFDLPTGPGEIADRLFLDGTFGIERGNFTELSIQEKLRSLSRRGQGKPNDEEAGSAVSALKGRFVLKDGVITFHDLKFGVTGADVELDGTYALRTGELDFHGHLRLDAKLSQVTSGIKSLLLKPVDPFFRKNGKTELPIKITGTRDHPAFGLNFGG